ncbi:uncharacterized protein YkwD [Pullulanibacillus pueri]|uniref:SCP domain-containing protein n=1 Tax=Pullulanibacillus pueri TaxID=1437324 RepID=A0A8J2ZTE4_9BACL|nr:uncharacterized protein YkwD [Pullulanibacillus pueri]GGH76977.1 hypothetical protein GCM10007096_08190 [Pullulanibacillus pueri]
MKKALTSGLVAFLLLIGIGTQALGQTFEEQVASLVNQERSKQGLNALTYNTALAKMAEDKAKDMYNKNYFSHPLPPMAHPSI